jgi:hypothetical protein
LSPLAGLATCPFAEAEFDHKYPPCIVQTAGHCQRMGKPSEIERDGSCLRGFALSPTSGCGNTLSRKRANLGMPDEPKALSALQKMVAAVKTSAAG